MNPAFYILFGLAIGAAAGGAIGWLLGLRRASSAPPDTRLETELRQQLAQRAADLNQLRENLTQAGTARAAAEAGRDSATRLLDAQRLLHEKTLKESQLAQEKALADLREAFKALSAEALKQTHPDFLRLANETLAKFQESAKGDLAQRQQTIATLVKPLEEQLKTYQQRLQQSESTQSTALGEVKKQLETLASQSQSLSNETLQLRRVLSSNQARGRWGEETLRRIVEAAGMSAHCDFSEQTQSESGDSKPDLLVHLPGDRLILVDAKVPDLDFLEAAESAEPARRAEALAVHAAKLKATIKALAERDYPSQFANTLDFVVLFLPAESLFSAALEGDRDLIIWAASRRIVLATPASLIAVLRAVSLSWQQHAQTENARAIAVAAQELFSRVVTFAEYLDKIRSGLETAGKAFNQAVGSYESRIRPAGEKLARLGGGAADKELADVQPLETALRLAPETDRPSAREPSAGI
jgi:DNA recombination protein RmuC